MEKWEKVSGLFKCLNCSSELVYTHVDEGGFKCKRCSTIYPLVDGVLRFVDKSFYTLDNEKKDIVEKTKNYFGYEWELFKDWGFLSEDLIAKDHLSHCSEGLASSRAEIFDRKCRLNTAELAEGKIVLDAGCGNGRYTYEAAIRAAGATVFGVDIGYGSVASTYKNTRELDNVYIIQASLFDLPFKDNSIDSSFSNGVLMHTGNARKAFAEIGRTIKPEGSFVVNIYKKLGPLWEMNDFLIRSITTRLSIESNMKFARFMAKASKLINRTPRIYEFTNMILRLQSTEIHMFDWYSAPIATHHSYSEVVSWFEENKMKPTDPPPPKYGWYKRQKFWAVNIKGKKVV